jgi:hypothetical protein
VEDAEELGFMAKNEGENPGGWLGMPYSDATTLHSARFKF